MKNIVSIATLFFLATFLLLSTSYAENERFINIRNNYIIQDNNTGSHWLHKSDAIKYDDVLATIDSSNEISRVFAKEYHTQWQLPYATDIKQIFEAGQSSHNDQYLPSIFNLNNVWVWVGTEDGLGAFNCVSGDVVLVDDDFSAGLLHIKKYSGVNLSKKGFENKISSMLEESQLLINNGNYYKSLEVLAAIIKLDIKHKQAHQEIRKALNLLQNDLNKLYIVGDLDQATQIVEELKVLLPHHELVHNSLYIHNQNLQIIKNTQHLSPYSKERFVKNHLGTIVDNQTKLDWVISDILLDWPATEQWIKKLKGEGYRLPTPQEVSGLVIDSGEGMQLDAIFGQVASYVWVKLDGRDSNNCYLYRVIDEELIGMSSGEGELYSVLAVRIYKKKVLPTLSTPSSSTSPDSRSFFDKNNGLEWFAGPKDIMSWRKATEWVNEIRKEDSGWRLPLQDELIELFIKKNTINIPTEFSYLTDGNVWSGEMADLHGAYLMQLHTGGLAWDYQVAEAAYPLAVRVKTPITTSALENETRYSKSAQGIITDQLHKKQWFLGPRRKVSKNDAFAWLSRLTAVHGTGWRFPTQKELKEIQRTHTPTQCRHGIWSDNSDYFDPDSIFQSQFRFIWASDQIINLIDIGSHNLDHITPYPKKFIEKYNMDELRVFAIRDVDQSNGIYPVINCKRYLEGKNGAVLDMKTGKQWILGPDKDMNWFEAYSWLNELNRFSSNKWEFPYFRDLYEIDSNNVDEVDRSETERIFGKADKAIWSGNSKREDGEWTLYYELGFGSRHVKRTYSKNMRFFAIRPLYQIAEQQLSIQKPKTSKSFTNSLGMQFSYISPGKFIARDDPNSIKEENGVVSFGQLTSEHEVTISTPFYLQQTEVTISQFLEFLNSSKTIVRIDLGNPRCPIERFEDNYRMKLGSGETWGNPEQPIVCIDWGAAEAFTGWLSKVEQKQYRLPSEAEWEYGVRAGSKFNYFYGDDTSQGLLYGWGWSNAYNMTHPVATKRPNAWGLYDVYGNVEEWMLDSKRVYKGVHVTNPLGDMSLDQKSVRGGHYTDSNVKFEDRKMNYMTATDPKVGFRVLLELPK